MPMTERNYFFCDSCGAQNPGGKNFCTKCGARMHAQAPKETAKSDISNCEKCGHPNAMTSKFCAACSAPLAKDFRVIDEGDYMLVEVNLDHIDFENHRDISMITKKLHNPRIILDMTEVKWIDSTGIGTMITVVRRLADEEKELKFFGVDPKVMSAIKALQAENVLEIFESRNEILVSWGFPPI
jgi:anti-sigma B factor antagonist